MPETMPMTKVPAEPGVSKPDPILRVRNVRKSFGGLVAVDVKHLQVQRGIITGLIGPNGAGKTTLFNLVTGFDRADGGSWIFDDKDMAGVPPHRAAQYGMVRTFQLTKALSKLTVLENMKLGATGQSGERLLKAPFGFLWRQEENAIVERADELLARFQLHHMRDEYAGTLSGGQRKLLEMARALMTEPSLVMLDEPMAGVNPALTQSLLEHVLSLPELGMTVVFVEHDMDVVTAISDWVVCMSQGSIIAEGPPASVTTNQAVIDAYLGEQHGDAARPVAPAAEPADEDLPDD